MSLPDQPPDDDEHERPGTHTEPLLRSISHDLREPLRSVSRRVRIIEAASESHPKVAAACAALLDSLNEFTEGIREYRRETKRIAVTFSSIAERLESMERHLTAVQSQANELDDRVGKKLRPTLCGVPRKSVEQHLKRIRKNTHRLKARFDGILLYAQAGGGLVYSQFSLKRETKRVKDDLEDLLVRESAEVEIEGDSLVSADQYKIAQLLQNAVQNSIRYKRPTDVPWVRVDIDEGSWRSLPDDAKERLPKPKARKAAYTMVSVSDNGQGIDPEHIDDIFLLFNRGGRLEDGDDVGGVGLAIAKSIVDAHHGCIWAANREPVGTTISFVIPTKRRK